jgi:hypothetical protein
MFFFSLKPWDYLFTGNTYRALNDSERAMHFQNIGLFFLLGFFLILTALAPELLPAAFVLGNNLTLGIYSAYLVLTYAAASFYLNSNPFPYLLSAVNGTALEIIIFIAKVGASIVGFVLDIANDLFCQSPEAEALHAPDEYRSPVKFTKLSMPDGPALGSAAPPLSRFPILKQRDEVVKVLTENEVDDEVEDGTEDADEAIVHDADEDAAEDADEAIVHDADEDAAEDEDAVEEDATEIFADGNAPKP